MGDRAPYSRVYWAIVDDPKFASIFDDNHHVATWLRLLLIADQAWPASASVPATARKSSIAALVTAGIVDPQSGGRYRVHGLDAERTRRSRTSGPVTDQLGPNRSVDGPSRARAPRLVSSVGTSSTSGGGVGEGLPNLTDEVARAATEATGMGVLSFGDKAQTELDRLCERHGGPVVIKAMATVVQAIPRPSPNQLVFGVVKVLEPFLDPKAAAAAEREHAGSEASRRRVAATIRQAHGFGAHDATPDPRCELCKEAIA